MLYFTDADHREEAGPTQRGGGPGEFLGAKGEHNALCPVYPSRQLYSVNVQVTPQIVPCLSDSHLIELGVSTSGDRTTLRQECQQRCTNGTLIQ